jgi:hypothetical protein
MRKIYKSEEVVQERIAMIVTDEQEGGDSKKEMSYGTVCCSPKFSRATLVGCVLSCVQQLTGVNAIMFYSNMLFKGVSLPVTLVTFLIGLMNFVATLVGLVLLIFYGRK